ncbi:MAG: NADH-quinone oxidoreductase subunit NuoG [Hyphomicrobiales bacterium]
MRKLMIDGQEVEVPAHYTLIQACEEAGAEVPRFCYHERLSVAGNCRMCLVEVKGGPPKPQASCALNVTDLRPGPEGQPPEVFTKSPMVKKAREGVMEFLLINHPLDCPICDQGGECDLQDQAMAYGIDSNRFAENKRAVEDKYIGPLVKTIMTRCIHCTRCVRFSTEVGGVSELGLVGRGEDAEITTYLEKAMTSELQGNVIDLCPVGALTSRPYAFQARPWELRKTESIDVMDALGSAIRIDARGREVMRIMPRLNEDVNEEWISDKTRFIWDGLRSQRLDKPFVRKNGKLQPATWEEAFSEIAGKLAETAPEEVGAIAGDLCAVEEMFALKELTGSLGSPNMDCREEHSTLDPANGRASYIFNSGISAIDEADQIMIIGANPRNEAAVLNARIRQRWRSGELIVGVIGEQADLTYDYEYLGAGPDTFKQFVDHGPSKGTRQMFIVGQGALARKDGKAILANIAKAAKSLGVVREDWNGFNVLHTAAARVGGRDIGFVPGEGGKATAEMMEDCSVLFLLGADELDFTKRKSGFTVYIGSHGDNGAHHADVILPGAAYTEKRGTYVNTEGRVQMTERAVFPPGDAREDWAIIRALSGVVGHTLEFDNADQLRAKLYEQVPHLAAIGVAESADAGAIDRLAAGGRRMNKGAFESPIEDFYLTNPIARASAVMAECSALRAGRKLDAAE